MGDRNDPEAYDLNIDVGLPVAVLAEPFDVDDVHEMDHPFELDEDEDELEEIIHHAHVEMIDPLEQMVAEEIPAPAALGRRDVEHIDDLIAARRQFEVEVLNPLAEADGRPHLVQDANDLHLMGAFVNLRGRNAGSVSSYLFDMIREGYTCTSVLAGWSRQLDGGCSRVVDRCSSHQDEAFFISSNGRTALHEACLRGSCSHVVRALLAANSIGVIYRDHQRNTPLHLLFVDYSTQISSIHPLEEMDAIVSELLAVSPTFLATATNDDGSTALHMACSASESMIPTSCLVKLLEADPSAASKVNKQNETALRLHCGRRNASVQVARILHEANPDAVFLQDAHGLTPLHYAAANTNLEVMRYLINANPNIARVRTAGGETALHLLYRQSMGLQELPCVDLLLQAYPDVVMQRDSHHLYTPLHLLCLAGTRVTLEGVERILEANPRAAEIADSELYLPLHHACERGCEADIVSAILRAYPSAAYAMTRKHDSALSLACTCNKSVATVQLLIEANSDALEKKNDYGFAPLHCVCRAYQPRMGIVQALLDARPSCVTLKTHGGETPVHLACSNSGAFVGVLQLLTIAQNNVERVQGPPNDLSVQVDARPMTNKVGNTPLHDACFRGSPFEHIETLAMSNPEWISVRNNAGYSPFQILCKNGRIDERIVTTFSRIGGPEIFSVLDSMGNTPIHSAMRSDIDLATLKCLIRALPDALHLKTFYGDSPLHLACLRHADPDVVREVALASSCTNLSPVLEPNAAGQTPIGIAMDEYRSVSRLSRLCWVVSDYLPAQQRVFQILATLVKILYYGPRYQDHKQLSLVRACVALHRQDVRLDPAFIRRAIHLYPEEVRVMDEEGNYPLHVEASIPVEKMFLLDSNVGCCGGPCHKRMGVLRMLLEIFPGATEARNKDGHFPLNLMIQNGRVWGHEIALTLRAFPPALHWHKGLDDRIMAHILEKASKECGMDTLFSLLACSPFMLQRRKMQESQRAFPSDE